MLKLVRTKFKLNKEQIDYVNENKAIINKRLYDIPQRLEHNSYLNRDNIEDANTIARTITKNSQIYTPFIINPKNSQLENQKYQQEDLAQHIPEAQSLTFLKTNPRSDVEEEQELTQLKRYSRQIDNKMRANIKLFDALEENLSDQE